MILIDTNEASTAPDIVARIKEYFGAGNCFITTLPSGDVAWPLTTGLLRIERKTVSDFVSSIADNRLFDQVNRMTKDSDWCAIVITGKLLFNSDDLLMVNGRVTQWRGTSVRAALRSVQWAGCAIEYSTVGNYPQALDELRKVAAREDHRHYSLRKMDRKPPIDFYPDETAVQDAIEFICGLPGIGPKLARELLTWCGDRDRSKIGRIASALEWLSLFPQMTQKALPAGWGTQRVQAALSFLGLSADEYLKVCNNPAGAILALEKELNDESK